MVAGFARAVGRIRPELRRAALTKPLTMLLFGMINWMFTWMDPEGPLDYDAMAPVVADLFLGGVPAVKTSAFAGLTDGSRNRSESTDEYSGDGAELH